MMRLIRRLINLCRNHKRKYHSRKQLKYVHRGDSNTVYGSIDIIEPNNLHIGSCCTFNHGCYIQSSNGITIGNDVTLSARSCIISTGIDYMSWSNGLKKHITNGAVSIGDHVWIGANAVILPGVSITGKYVVIAANAVVTKDITDDYCIFGGCPAALIKCYR